MSNLKNESEIAAQLAQPIKRAVRVGDRIEVQTTADFIFCARKSGGEKYRFVHRFVYTNAAYSDIRGTYWFQPSRHAKFLGNRVRRLVQTVEIESQEPVKWTDAPDPSQNVYIHTVDRKHVHTTDNTTDKPETGSWRRGVQRRATRNADKLKAYDAKRNDHTLTLTNAEWNTLLRAAEFYRAKVTEAERSESNTEYTRAFYTREAVLVGSAVEQLTSICCF